MIMPFLYSYPFLWVSLSPQNIFGPSQLPHLLPGLPCILWPISVLNQSRIISWCTPVILCTYLPKEIISSFKARKCTIFLSLHYSTKKQRDILINTVLNWIKYIEPASDFNKFIDHGSHQRLLYMLYMILSTSCCCAQWLPLLLNISSLYLQFMDSMTQILPKCIYKIMKKLWPHEPGFVPSYVVSVIHDFLWSGKCSINR